MTGQPRKTVKTVEAKLLAKQCDHLSMNCASIERAAIKLIDSH